MTPCIVRSKQTHNTRNTHPMQTVPQSASCLAHTPNPLQLIERAGRVCYKSESKITATSADKFIRMILARGHESVLEHASATFHIITDRGISHEIVRHRLASYSQESTRYCSYKSSDLVFIDPGFKRRDNATLWERACMEAEDAYKRILQYSTPQCARSVLPNSLKTEIVMTANFREWRHFLRMRAAQDAHPQIQAIAGMILSWFTETYPVIVEDLGLKQEVK